MKVLSKKDWDYTLYEEDDKVYLEVLCGTSALFEVKVMLSEDEKMTMQADPEFIARLAQKIRHNPRQYS